MTPIENVNRLCTQYELKLCNTICSAKSFKNFHITKNTEHYAV